MVGEIGEVGQFKELAAGGRMVDVFALEGGKPWAVRPWVEPARAAAVREAA